MGARGPHRPPAEDFAASAGRRRRGDKSAASGRCRRLAEAAAAGSRSGASPARRSAALQVCRLAGLQVCRFSGFQVCRFPFRFAGRPWRGRRRSSRAHARLVLPLVSGSPSSRAPPPSPPSRRPRPAPPAGGGAVVGTASAIAQLAQSARPPDSARQRRPAPASASQRQPRPASGRHRRAGLRARQSI